jgi:hypothetical protein
MDDMNPVMFENPGGTKFWYLDDIRHRTDGPAVEWANGDTEWWQHGIRHRTDGPAIEYADGTKAWLLNDDYHRTDGPAIEYASGGMSWYLRGHSLSFDEWLDQNPDMTGEEKVMFKLQYG